MMSGGYAGAKPASMSRHQETQTQGWTLAGARLRECACSAAPILWEGSGIDKKRGKGPRPGPLGIGGDFGKEKREVRRLRK